MRVKLTGRYDPSVLEALRKYSVGGRVERNDWDKSFVFDVSDPESTFSSFCTFNGMICEIVPDLPEDENQIVESD